MSSLYDQIQADLRQAMKAKEVVRLGTLRMLKSDLQYELTKTGATEISDEEVLAVIRRAIKKRRESIEQYRKGGREEQAAQEAAELEVLETYLPAALGDDAIVAVVDEVLGKLGAAGPGDMGKAMGQVMGRLKGQNVDGNRVRQLVQERLAKA